MVGTLAATLAGQAALRQVMPEVPSATVFITETGDKYHESSCRHLKKSRKEISLEEAKKQGYKPCSVCKPPE
jgi:transposase